MKLITLANFPSEFEATLARNILKANGVHATFAGRRPIIAWRGVPQGETVLVVEEKDLERAIHILREAKEQAEPHGEWSYPEREKILSRFRRAYGIALLVILGFAIVVLALVWFAS